MHVAAKAWWVCPLVGLSFGGSVPWWVCPLVGLSLALPYLVPPSKGSTVVPSEPTVGSVQWNAVDHDSKERAVLAAHVGVDTGAWARGRAGDGMICRANFASLTPVS